jgi:RNA recognition motif-containing protein
LLQLHDIGPAPPAAPPCLRRLFVGNIPKTCTHRELLAVFSSCGRVIDLRLHTARFTRAHSGSAFLW